MKLKMYNAALPSVVQQNDATVAHIRGRQGQFFTQQDAEPSPFMTTKLLTTLLDLAASFPDNVEGLTEMRQKVRSKWIGPQGQQCNRDAIESALRAYFPTRRPEVHLDVPGPVKLVFRAMLYNALNANYTSYTIEDIKTGKPFRKKSSNSGYYGFTSDFGAKLRLLDGIDALISLCWNDAVMYHPAILWYRHQRRKFRCIFGDSLVNLAIGKLVGSKYLEQALYNVPEVAYCSELVTAKRIQSFVRGCDDFTVLEGDYEAMDTTVSLSLAIQVMRLVFELTDQSYHDWCLFEQLLAMYFNQPLVDYDCNVITREHSLFSGQFPTNGLEDYINILAQLLTLWEYSNGDEYVFYDLVDASCISVMGDDSGLILRGSHDGDALKQCFVNTAAKLDLKANLLKQRVSRKSVWFCKRGFQLKPEPKHLRSSGIPVPVYPIDLALNSIAFPESGPLSWGNGDSRDYTQEIPSILARFDNAVSDPAWRDVVTTWALEYGPKDLVNGALLAMQRGWKDDEWKREVQGTNEWSPAFSPTYKLILTLSRH